MAAPQISFEFSAPRDEEAFAKVTRVHGRLAELKPHFFSVTYGAGGSTKDGTRQAVVELNRLGTPVAAHVSFGTGEPAQLEELLAGYKDEGVTGLVALRGDLPSGVSSSKQLPHANELVTFIRKRFGDHFHIHVAAYPELHPESDSFESEIRHFKTKVDAGADDAITQYFYNADAYFRFIDLATAAGVSVPVFPGVMPITNYEGLMRFSKICGADIPRWIERTLWDYREDPTSLKAFGDDVVTRLCERLLSGGAPGLHFYTLNQAAPSLRICERLSLG